MKRWVQKLYVVVTVLLLLTTGLLAIKGPEQGISKYEQRTLAYFPVPNQKGLWEGWYTGLCEEALSDRIPGRDMLLREYTRVHLLMGKPVVNGLVVSQDQLVDFYNYSRWDLEYLKGEADKAGMAYDSLNRTVTEYGGYFLYVGLPLASQYFSASYPSYMDNRMWHSEAIRQAFSQAMEEHQVPFLDMVPVYAGQGNPSSYYYQTDHHYTGEGAFAAYTACMERLNVDTGWKIPYLGPEDVVEETFAGPFLGSANRKLYGLWKTDDTLRVVKPKESVPFTRTEQGVPVEAEVFCRPENPEEAVSYSVYMGGDQAETVIQTNRPWMKNALIFGDSFTNPQETLLWTSFNETRCVDFRYYHDQSCLEYIQSYHPDVVLCFRDESVYLNLENNGAVN